jgi:hypothetical protein
MNTARFEQTVSRYRDMETPLGDAAGVSRRMPTHAPERDLRHQVNGGVNNCPSKGRFE